MPLYAIHCIDKPDSVALRLANRPAHLEHLKSTGDGMVIAGPLLNDGGDPIGSIVIVDFPDRKAATAFAAADPYARAGLFASVAVTAWRKTLPAD